MILTKFRCCIFGAAVGVFSMVGAAGYAQQRPATPAELQGVITALSAQLDATRNLHIQAEAKAAGLAEENAKLKAQVEELQKKADPPK